jgi:AraC-like DNA-binding protein
MNRHQNGDKPRTMAALRRFHDEEEKTTKVVPRSSLLRQLRTRRRARQLERIRLADTRELARRVQDIIIECGLTQTHFSLSGGCALRIPEVVSVIGGPLVGLTIRTLPGQTPDHFAAHAQEIAYHLGIAEVRVVPIESSIIRLDLLPKPD